MVLAMPVHKAQEPGEGTASDAQLLLPLGDLEELECTKMSAYQTCRRRQFLLPILIVGILTAVMGYAAGSRYSRNTCRTRYGTPKLLHVRVILTEASWTFV